MYLSQLFLYRVRISWTRWTFHIHWNWTEWDIRQPEIPKVYLYAKGASYLFIAIVNLIVLQRVLIYEGTLRQSQGWDNGSAMCGNSRVCWTLKKTLVPYFTRSPSSRKQKNYSNVIFSLFNENECLFVLCYEHFQQNYVSVICFSSLMASSTVANKKSWNVLIFAMKTLLPQNRFFCWMCMNTEWIVFCIHFLFQCYDPFLKCAYLKECKLLHLSVFYVSIIRRRWSTSWSLNIWKVNICLLWLYC